MGKLRRLTRRWITLTEGRGSEGGGLWVTRLTWTGNREGTTAWRERMERCEGVDGAAVQDPCDMAKTGLFEASSQGWKCASSDIQRPERSHQYQANPLCFAPTFRLVDGEQRAYSRERTGRLRHARYVQRKGNSGSPKGREPYGDGVPVVVVGVTPHRGEREGRSQGEVAQVSTDRPGKAGYA
jgi:hypothetical protein